MMSRLKDLLKPGGWVLANEPQGGNPLVRLSRKIREKIDSKYSTDQQEFSIEQLYAIFQEAGLTDIRIHPRGIFSTPFAEVILPFGRVATGLSRLACQADKLIERKFRSHLAKITWNAVAAGRKAVH